MLALKKKKEAEKKAAAEAAAAESGNKDESTESSSKPQKVSLLGVGGKKKKDNGSNKEGKKRTAGEIRIQKGWFQLNYEFFYSDWIVCFIGVFRLMMVIFIEKILLSWMLERQLP